MNPEQNLDYLAAKHAQAFIRDAKGKGSEIDNEVTKALGVLQENGVYACFLYLQPNKKENSAALTQAMCDLLEALDIKKKDEQDVLTHIAENVTNDLRRLLLAKEVLEQMLIYARYGAKAAGKQ